MSSQLSAPQKKEKRQWFNRHQADILSERYLDVILGSPGSSLLFLLQAPVIALSLAIAWDKIGQATGSLHFMMVISAIWFGCVNACQEIAKEKAIYRRERMFDLNILSYVYSKAKILSIFGFIQCLLLLGIVQHYLNLKGNLILIFSALFLSYLAAMMLGLILSALVNTPDKALLLAPVLTIPQIIFSEPIVPRKYLTGVAGGIENLMISKWGYGALIEISANELKYLELAKNLGVLLLFLLIYYLITATILKMSDRNL